MDPCATCTADTRFLSLLPQIWEAFEAGTIPIVLRSEAAGGSLGYVVELGLGDAVMLIDSWNETADRLLEWEAELRRDPGPLLARQVN